MNTTGRQARQGTKSLDLSWRQPRILPHMPRPDKPLPDDITGPSRAGSAGLGSRLLRGRRISWGGCMLDCCRQFAPPRGAAVRTMQHRRASTRQTQASCMSTLVRPLDELLLECSSSQADGMVVRRAGIPCISHVLLAAESFDLDLPCPVE